MPRRSTTNFLDQLLGGAARGYQFSQQLQNQQRQRELQERGLDLSEQGLDIRQEQLGLNQQKFMQGQLLRKSILDRMGGGINAVPTPDFSRQVPDTQPNIFVQPQQPTPSIQPQAAAPAPRRQFVPAERLPLDPRDVITEKEIPGAVSLPEPPMPGKPIITPDVVDMGAPGFFGTMEDVPQITPPVPTPTPAPVRKRVEPQAATPDQFNALMQWTQDVDAASQLGGESVTLTADGINFTTKINSAAQGFTKVKNFINKKFGETITAAQFARIFASSPRLLESKPGKNTMERLFTNEVNRKQSLAEFELRSQLSVKTLNQFQRNEVLRGVVQDVGTDLGVVYGQKFQDILGPQDVALLSMTEELSNQLLSEFGTQDDLIRAFQTDPKGTQEFINQKLAEIRSDKFRDLTLKVDQGTGKLVGVIQEMDSNRNVTVGEVPVNVKGTFTRPSQFNDITFKTRQQLFTNESKVIASGNELGQILGDLGTRFNAIPAETQNAVLGVARDFNSFTNSFFKNLQGMLKPGTFEFAGDIMNRLLGSDFYQKKIVGLTPEAQAMFSDYTFAILRLAEFNGLGQGRALSDKDLDFVKKIISDSNATNFKASVTAVNDRLNKRLKLANENLSILSSGRLPRGKQFADPFTGAIPHVLSTTKGGFAELGLGAGERVPQQQPIQQEVPGVTGFDEALSILEEEGE